MTAQQIIDRAFGRSKSSQQGVDVSEEGELLPELARVLRVFFQLAVRINPMFFSASKVVAPSLGDGTWTRPPEAEAVWWILDSEGAEVAVVPAKQQDAEPGKPSIYRMGQLYFPVEGNAPSGLLEFHYSKRPDPLPTLETEIDPLWPETYAPLLDLELAVYIAAKDESEADLANFAAQRDRELQSFMLHLEHELTTEVRQSETLPRFGSGAPLPLSSLLNGPTSVEAP